MKRFIPLGIVLAIIGIAFLLFNLEQKALKDTAEAAGVTVSKKSIQQENKAEKTTIDIEYPLIQGLPQDRQKAVNSQIKKMIDEQISSFKEQAKQNEGGLPEGVSATTNGLTIRYSVARSDSEYVSIEMSNSVFMRGAAHPNTFVTTLNYDVEAGKVLSLDTLFKEDSDYLTVLSNYSIEDLKKQYKEDMQINDDDAFLNEMIQTGASPDANNFKNFTLTDRDFIVVFDPYQVGPYSAGVRHVAIPYKNLETVLKDKYKFSLVN